MARSMRPTSNPEFPERLVALLQQIRLEPRASSGERLSGLVALLRPGRREPPEVAESRVRQLVRVLQDQPALAAALGQYVAELLATRTHRVLYADSGVVGNQGFWGSLGSRLLGRLLPPAVETGFLRDLFVQVFEHPRDHEWLATIPGEVWDALLAALDSHDPGFTAARRRCRREMLEAMRLASYRLAALGTEPALLNYLPALARHESPFLAQNDEVRAFIGRQSAADAPPTDPDDHLGVLLEQCEEYVDSIRRRSREAGVAVNLVFLLARVEQVMARLRLLRDLIAPRLPRSAAETRRLSIDFVIRLVRQENRRHSVRDLFAGMIDLLARRVTEHASHSGEHYVCRNHGELIGMYRAAAGAGLVIAAMALVKILLVQLELPLLWEAAALSVNYGLGFVLIHVLGLTIATKQPAMTAATLAATLDGSQGREARLEALTRLAAEVNRSQWVSITGNVTVGFLAAMAIAMTAGVFLGWQPVDADKAGHLLHDLHPWRTLALIHAGIAGVYLFLSGLISGYYDNQALYHRVPERLQRVRLLRQLLGERRLRRLADYVRHNLGALVGNFLFGCMLGCTPVFGELLGLPLDIRHVAFASANLAYGLQGMGFGIGLFELAVSILGVLLIGFVNLLVSFSLAMRVALRSRGIRPEQTRGLSARLLRRFLQRPRDFFWVPGDAVTETPPPTR
jgi:site-specific recombinase